MGTAAADGCTALENYWRSEQKNNVLDSTVELNILNLSLIF